jgi:thioredoxin-like negative regulator of GroEL
METITSIAEFERIRSENEAILVYFSTEACTVCKVLKPKVAEMAETNFPKMKLFFAGSDQLPELAAQNRVFAVPTILIFFDGRETIRKSRTFGIDELKSEISRPYAMIFD